MPLMVDTKVCLHLIKDIAEDGHPTHIEPKTALCFKLE